MELIQIGDNALKVMLTRADMEYYEIVFDTLDYNNAETRRALTKILAEAERKVGFFVESESLYIQAFSDGDGGCELFVRRGEEKKQLYAFDGMPLLICGCARLYNCGFLGESSAYISNDESKYYLLLPRQKDGAYVFLSEIARKTPLRRGFLEEHTKKLCDNAVETLARMK